VQSDINTFWQALSLITNILVTITVQFGVGRHAVYLQEEQRVNALFMIWLSVSFSTGGATVGKISVALLLIRLVHRIHRLQEAFYWTLIFLLVVINLLLIIVTFVQCTPVTFLWRRITSDARGTCWSLKIQRDIWYFQGAFSALSDLFLALSPLPILWNLQMSFYLRLGHSILMALGIM
jgi:hypothetical protein